MRRRGPKCCYQKLLTELQCSAGHSPGKTVLGLCATAVKLRDISRDAICAATVQTLTAVVVLAVDVLAVYRLSI